MLLTVVAFGSALQASSLVRRSTTASGHDGRDDGRGDEEDGL